VINGHQRNALLKPARNLGTHREERGGVSNHRPRGCLVRIRGAQFLSHEAAYIKKYVHETRPISDSHLNVAAVTQKEDLAELGN